MPDAGCQAMSIGSPTRKGKRKNRTREAPNFNARPTSTTVCHQTTTSTRSKRPVTTFTGQGDSVKNAHQFKIEMKSVISPAPASALAAVFHRFDADPCGSQA